MSYLGYFAPTYLKCIDGWIGDKILFDNLNTIQKDAHKLHYIDAGYMAYEMDENVKIKKTRREEFTFGCFNHSRKLTDETIELFSEILIKCKNSKLTLKSISFNERKEVENIEQKFEGYNIDRGRLNIRKATKTKEEHLELYNEIDVALDHVIWWCDNFLRSAINGRTSNHICW